MNFFGIVVVLMALAYRAQCQECPARSWPVANYLARPTITEHDAPAFNWIKTTLGELKLKEPKEILKFFQETKMDMLNNGRITVGHKGRGVAVADEIYELTLLADDQLKLTPYTVSFYIKIVEFVFGNLEVMSEAKAPDHDVGLFSYLKHYGQIKFTSLFSNLNDNYQEEYKRFKGKNEIVLDELIASQEKDHVIRKNKTALNDSHLTQLASRIDLLAGDFDAKRMMRVAIRRAVPFPVEKRSYAYLWTFIASHCTGLVYTFNNLLDVINMVRLLSQESLSMASLPEKLTKFNEYGRICYQALGLDTREQVQLNIRDGLQGHLSKFLKKVAHCG